MADGSLPKEGLHNALEQVPNAPAHKAESIDAALAEGRIDRLQEAMATAADLAAKELDSVSEAARVADDPEAAAVNQEIAQADAVARQQLDAAQAEARQEIDQATKDVAVSPQVDAMGAMEGDSVETVKIGGEAAPEKPAQEQVAVPVGEQIKKIDSLAEGAKQRMRELYQSLMKMKESGGELDEKELEVYKQMVDNDQVLNDFVEAMQMEFRNDQNEGSVRARAAQFASEFALGARSQMAYAEALARKPVPPPAVETTPAAASPKETPKEAPKTAPTSETKKAAKEEVGGPSPERLRLDKEKAVFQRLRQIDGLVEQASQSPNRDISALMALREQIDALHAQNVVDWDALKDAGGVQNEALNDLQSHMVDVMNTLDAVLAEQDPTMQTQHIDRLGRLRKQGASDVSTLEQYFIEEDQKQTIAEHQKNMESRRIMFEELTGQVDMLMSSFKAANFQAGPDQIRTLRKLMAKTHPDTNGNDEGMTRVYKVLSSLKMAFEGDQSAWKNPRGGSLELEFSELKKELGVRGEESDQTEEELQATAKATERPVTTPVPSGENEPNPVYDEAAETARRMDAMESLLTKKVRKVEAAFDEVLASGDEKKIEGASGLLKELYGQRMKDVTKEINAYYKLPASERTKKSEKKIAIMLYEEELLGAQMDAHEQKVRLGALQREKVKVDEEVGSLQKQLEALKTSDSGLLLGARSSMNAIDLARADAAPAVSAPNAEALSASLKAALAKQADLAAKIGLGAAALSQIYAGIDRIVKLRAKAQEELEGMSEDKKKEKIEMVYKDVANDNAYGNSDSRVQSDHFDLSGKPGGKEGSGSKTDSWFEKIGDVVAEAMHGDESSIQGAKNLLSQAGRAITAPSKKAA